MRLQPVGRPQDWAHLLRIDRPVGYWLLLWPTLWGLLAASHGQPQFRHFVIFVAGVFLMRSAGCVINDFADRSFDPHVERTKDRPIAAGRIAPGAALAGFVLLMLLALLLVMQTSVLVVGLAIVGAFLASLYPFLKRHTHFPQAWLGMAFGWGAVMAWAAERGTVLDAVEPWLLFLANVFWSLCYDTAYALADREDDRRIGVKSTALWFGERAVPAIVMLGAGCLALLAVAAWMHGGFWVWVGWMLAAAYQAFLSYEIIRRGESFGFSFFLRSHWMGLLFVLGLLAEGLFP